jgi:hypothetical protein
MDEASNFLLFYQMDNLIYFFNVIFLFMILICFFALMMFLTYKFFLGFKHSKSLIKFVFLCFSIIFFVISIEVFMLGFEMVKEIIFEASNFLLFYMDNLLIYFFNVNAIICNHNYSEKLNIN